MNITIFGSGYVGLVTAACFADAGNYVVCVDVDASKTALLSKGQCPIYEPGLEEMLCRNLDEGRIRFTTSAAEGVAHGLYQFIAVGTPPNEDGSADMRYVLAVAEAIAANMNEYRIVISKSTVPVGTAARIEAVVRERLAQRRLDVPFDVVSNPEFLKEGAAVDDFNKPDRIIIGASSERAVEHMQSLYAPFNRNRDRVIVMDSASSELTKYAANAMLATKISFMNEIANVATQVGADVEKVRIGIGADPRIGYHFIYPGCGYGGSCFPKDVKALVNVASSIGVEPQLLRAVEAVNEQQKTLLFRKLQQHFGDLRGRVIGLWGLAFKPRTDDMREAPSRTLIDAVLAAGGRIRAFDPVAGAECQRLYGNRSGLEVVNCLESACEGADALAIVTEWRMFHSPDFELIKTLLKQPVIFDGRNLYDPRLMAQAGIRYYSIGRPTV